MEFIKQICIIPLFVFLLSIKRTYSQDVSSLMQPYSEISVTSPQCNGTDVLSKVVRIFGNSTQLEYSMPKDSCIVCLNPNCTENCPKPPNDLKDNFLEHGIFSSHLPENSYFEVTFNDKCVFNLIITPSENFTTLNIVLNECQIVGPNDTDCSELFSHDETDLEPENSCLVLTLSFDNQQRIRYKFTFGCDKEAPEFKQNYKFANIKSKDCHYIEETYSPGILYRYREGNVLFQMGIGFTMPCSPEGFDVRFHNEKYRTDGECADILRNELKPQGYTFIRELSEDYKYPDDEMLLNNLEMSGSPVKRQAPVVEEGNSELDKCLLAENPLAGIAEVIASGGEVGVGVIAGGGGSVGGGGGGVGEGGGGGGGGGGERGDNLGAQAPVDGIGAIPGAVPAANLQPAPLGANPQIFPNVDIGDDLAGDTTTVPADATDSGSEIGAGDTSRGNILTACSYLESLVLITYIMFSFD